MMIKQTVQISVPKTIRELIGEIPYNEATPEIIDKVMAAIAVELITCFSEASRAREPMIFLNPMCHAGSQYIWEFGVNDLSLPQKERYNCHGQNVSQWVYTGSILLQGGKVSKYHFIKSF